MQSQIRLTSQVFTYGTSPGAQAKETTEQLTRRNSGLLCHKSKQLSLILCFKDYKKALSKYAMIRMYVRSILPPEDKEAASYTSGVGTPATDKQMHDAKDIASVTFLNMSICFFLLGDYHKAVEKATDSLKYKKTLKALYRRGKAYQKRQDYERAIADMQEAIRMDPSDPNDIGQELVQLRLQQKEQTKKANAKMAGFLLRDEDKE